MALAQPAPRASAYAGLAAMILLLLAIVGGWAAWKYMGISTVDPDSPNLADVAAIGPANIRRFGGGPGGGPGWNRRGGPGGGPPPNFQGFAARVASGVPDGIRPLGQGFFVKADAVNLNVNRNNNTNNNWRFNFNLARAELLTADETQTFRLPGRVAADPAWAQRSGATPAQLNKLRALTNLGMVVDPPDREAIKTLFLNWYTAAGGTNAATRPSVLPNSNSPAAKDAEQKLIAALDALGKKQLEPTRQQYLQRIEEIQGILGAQLVTKLKNGG